MMRRKPAQQLHPSKNTMFKLATSERVCSRVRSERFGWIFACLLTLPLLAGTPSAVWSAEYYIDQNNPSASDQNPGTISQPWRTITKANQTLVAGDTVYIRAGTYTSSSPGR